MLIKKRAETGISKKVDKMTIKNKSKERWYSVNLVYYTKFKSGGKYKYRVAETIILVTANSGENARKKGEIYGKTVSPNLQNEFPELKKQIKWKYLGARMFGIVQFDINSNGKDFDGADVAHAQIVIKKWRDVQKMMRGEPVKIRFEY